MHTSSVYVLFISWILLLYPLSESHLISGSIHNSDSIPDSEISPFPPIDGFQPPDITPSSDNTGLSPSSPQIPYVTPASPLNNPSAPPAISDTPLPTPQLPIISSPPSDNYLPVSPQLPLASPPHDSYLPDSPQLSFASSPPVYNTLPGSPHLPSAYHHPTDTQPGAPGPFGINPSGLNQASGYGQGTSGLFGQQQNSNDMPFGGQYGSCSSIRADLLGTAMASIGILLISWV